MVWKCFKQKHFHTIIFLLLWFGGPGLGSFARPTPFSGLQGLGSGPGVPGGGVGGGGLPFEGLAKQREIFVSVPMLFEFCLGGWKTVIS